MEASQIKNNQSEPNLAGNDLWALSEIKAKEQAAQITDKTIVFVGEKKSGKSSLIAKFLDEPVKDDMKETTALEFRFGIRIIEERKQKVNVYELGGGRILSSLLSAPLNPFNLPNTAVCITVDLSQPGGALDSLQYWLNVVRENVQKGIEELSKTAPAIADQMRSKIDEKWEKHEDRTKVSLCLIPIIVLGTKFDSFANQFESVKKKLLCQALRYFCHANGCDLVFVSIKEKLPTQLFRAMLNRHIFDSNTQTKVERDHNQPLNVYSGTDGFLHIGEPEGAGMRGKVSFEKLFMEVIDQNFQKVVKDSQSLTLDSQKYAEDKIDQMRKQKDEELEQYKKEIERAKRFETQKASGEKPVVLKKRVAAGGPVQKVRLNKQ